MRKLIQKSLLFIVTSFITFCFFSGNTYADEHTLLPGETSTVINFSERPGVLAADYLSQQGTIVNQSQDPVQYHIFSNISRRERLKIMMNLSPESVEDVCQGIFSDLDANDWGCKYAESALKNSYIAENTEFRPNDPVTQAEALKMIMQATGIDKNQTDDWKYGYSSKALTTGLIDYEIMYLDSPAQRRFVFLASARTYSDFKTLEQESISQKSDIYTMISRRSRFSTLARLIEIAGEIEYVDSTGPFTFFAPTDFAFSRLPEGSIEKLLQADNLNELRDILTFHFVSGAFTKEQLSAGIDINAVSGNTLVFG